MVILAWAINNVEVLFLYRLTGSECGGRNTAGLHTLTYGFQGFQTVWLNQFYESRIIKHYLINFDRFPYQKIQNFFILTTFTDRSTNDGIKICNILQLTSHSQLIGILKKESLSKNKNFVTSS